MRLCVTGKHGQFAQSIKQRIGDDVDLTFVGRPGFDLSNPDTVLRSLDEAQPDVVISAAAYTAVDQAESEVEKAFAVNAIGAGAVAQAAEKLGVPLLHLSTDYVFPGTATRQYRETDETGPRTVYGRSKLEGEIRVADACSRHLILRTAWVYSPFGKNFVRTMLNAAVERDQVSVIHDQRGNPTSALDLADALIHIARSLLDKNVEEYGVFHICGSGETDWSEFARHIFDCSAALGGPAALVNPIPSDEYPLPAKRPANSSLDCSKLLASYGWRLPHWRISTNVVVRQLLDRS